MGWNGLGKAVQLFFSVVKLDEFLLRGGGVRKEVATCSRVIKYNHSARLPTFSTPQSNGNDVDNGNGNKVRGDKEGDGKGGKSHGSGNKDEGRATNRVTARAGRTIATAI